MGAVYEVRRISDGKYFAMKLILGLSNPTALARLAREAQNALRVEHPHVIAVRDIGVTEHHEFFVVMDLVVGNSLSSEKDRFGEPRWSLHVLWQVCQGLAAVHKVGIVHRDIKPSNVMLSMDDGMDLPHARITDFGISANAIDEQQRSVQDTEPNLTQTGNVVGTPAYMAPDMHMGSTKPDQSADIFSFGIMAREVLGLEKAPPTLPHGLVVAVYPDVPLPKVEGQCPWLTPQLSRALDASLSIDPSLRPNAQALADLFRECKLAHESRDSILGLR
jgi:serine/threonine protein kinase